MRKKHFFIGQLAAFLMAGFAITNANAEESPTQWRIANFTVGVSCQALLESLSPELRARLTHISDSGVRKLTVSPCSPPVLDTSGYDQLQLTPTNGTGKREAYRFVIDSSKVVVVVEYLILWDSPELRPGIQGLSDQLQSRYGTPYARLIPPDTMFAYSAHMDARWSSSRTGNSAPRDFNQWVFMDVCEKRMPTPAAAIACMQKAYEIPSALDAFVDSTSGIRLEALIFPDRKGNPRSAQGMRLTLADSSYENQWRERRKTQLTLSSAAQEQKSRNAEESKLPSF